MSKTPKDLVVVGSSGLTKRKNLSESNLPEVVKAAGHASAFAYEEFLFGEIRNPHTRRAYSHAVNRLFAWMRAQNITLQEVSPRDISSYLDSLVLAAPSKKLHRAALNHFFDFQVKRHAVVLNPVSSVRNEKHSVDEDGRTPEISVKDAKKLFGSIDISNVVGLRDRAILATIAYSGSRIGALARITLGDFYQESEQWMLKLHTKGGKNPILPVRHDLQLALRDYIAAAGIDVSDKKAPLFRSALPRKKLLTQKRMTENDMHRMFKRRIRAAGLSEHLSPHSFRVTTITELLKQGVALEDVQNLAGHADPRTTRLYDRRKRKITRNIVERIPIYTDIER